MKKILLFIILFQNCSNSTVVKDNLYPNSHTDNLSNITIKLNPQNLSFEARNITQKWSSLPKLEKIIEYLISRNYSGFMETDNYLKEFIIELKKTLPESLNFPSIISRIVVLETNILELESILTNKQIKKEKMVLATNKSIESYYNLLYQINKTIEKEQQKITN